MENHFLDKDIKLFYVTASSFPAGIKKAYETLHAMLPDAKSSKYFGISYPNGKGEIIYKAAVEELFIGEAEKLHCETFTVKKGNFISETLHDWQKDETQIGKTFQQMLAHPGIAKNGYCLEVYLNDKDVRCMIPLEEK